MDGRKEFYITPYETFPIAVRRYDRSGTKRKAGLPPHLRDGKPETPSEQPYS